MLCGLQGEDYVSRSKVVTYDALKSVTNARVLYYDLFAGFFLYELLEVRAGLLLEQIKIMKENPLRDEDGVHFELLESELTRNGVAEIRQEYTRTFILPFTSTENLDSKKSGEKAQIVNAQVMLYLSHYREGCINGESLVKARRLVKQTSFRLNSQECKESEEHLGFLLLLMRHLLLSQDEHDRKICKDVALELVIPLGGFVAKALIDREDLSFYSSVGHLFDGFLKLENNLW